MAEYRSIRGLLVKKSDWKTYNHLTHLFELNGAESHGSRIELRYIATPKGEYLYLL